jgi:hypothetical protein
MKNCFMWKHHGHTVPCHFGCTDVCQIGVSRANNRESGPFLESFVASLNPAAWYKYLAEIDTSGWGDQSGNGNDMEFFNSPTVDANGATFNGTNQYGQASFTLNQPNSVYVLGKQITWTSGDRWFNGFSGNMLLLQAGTATPALRMNAGSAITNEAGLTLNTYGVVSCVFNNASGVLQVNNATPTAGVVGAGNGGGIVLAADGTPANFGNIATKEIIIFPAAHDAGQRAKVIAYLAQVGNLTI